MFFKIMVMVVVLLMVVAVWCLDSFYKDEEGHQDWADPEAERLL